MLLGGDNSETIKCMQSLADVLASMGELHKAEEEYQKVYKLLEKTAGKDHASTIEVVHDLAALKQSAAVSPDSQERNTRRHSYRLEVGVNMSQLNDPKT